MTVVKFPYSACRRVHSRRQRISKNGTPEERAAKAAAGIPTTTTATVVEISRRGVSRATPQRVFSSDEFAANMALLGQQDRQFIIDYMNLALAKYST
jgi:hypothetical protein